MGRWQAAGGPRGPALADSIIESLAVRAGSLTALAKQKQRGGPRANRGHAHLPSGHPKYNPTIRTNPQMIPGDLKYTEEHEWIRQEGKLVTVGISDFAQDQMTDIVFVELPETGRKVSAGEAIVVLESVKSVADVYAPTSGTVTEINSDLEHHPEYINESPYEKGWIFKMEASGEITAKFLDAEGYQAFIDTQ